MSRFGQHIRACGTLKRIGFTDISKKETPEGLLWTFRHCETGETLQATHTPDLRIPYEQRNNKRLETLDVISPLTDDFNDLNLFLSFDGEKLAVSDGRKLWMTATVHDNDGPEALDRLRLKADINGRLKQKRLETEHREQEESRIIFNFKNRSYNTDQAAELVKEMCISTLNNHGNDIEEIDLNTARPSVPETMADTVLHQGPYPLKTLVGWLKNDPHLLLHDYLDFAAGDIAKSVAKHGPRPGVENFVKEAPAFRRAYEASLHNPLA